MAFQKIAVPANAIAPVEFRLGADVFRQVSAEGERVWVAINYFPDVNGDGVRPQRAESDDELEKTLGYWKEWWHTCRYEGCYAGQVRRLLTLPDRNSTEAQAIWRSTHHKPPAVPSASRGCWKPG